MKFSAVLALTAAALVAGQANDLGECANGCIQRMIAKASAEFGCGAGDIKCYCTEPRFTYGMNDCSKEACGPDVQEKVLAYGTTFCVNQGGPGISSLISAASSLTSAAGASASSAASSASSALSSGASSVSSDASAAASSASGAVSSALSSASSGASSAGAAASSEVSAAASSATGAGMPFATAAPMAGAAAIAALLAL